jgi:hypothetical protein
VNNAQKLHLFSYLFQPFYGISGVSGRKYSIAGNKGICPGSYQRSRILKCYATIYLNQCIAA